jgi:thiazole synthase ThiGH ThiG subunit
MTFDPALAALIQGQKDAIQNAADAVMRADDPVAIREAITRLWSAGHCAYQATLDAENTARRSALARIGEFV